MSGSSSETITVLGKTFARHDLSPEVLSQLSQQLELFISKHIHREDSLSPRVQEELRRICNDTLGTEPTKLQGFVLALTVLAPYLRRIAELQPWFDFVVTVLIDAQESRKSLIQQTQDFVVAALSYDKDAPDALERSKSIQGSISKLLQEYLRRTAALTEGTVTTTIRSQNRAQQQLQDIIVLVGRYHPQDLFSAFESHLQNPSSRYHALQLMSAWLQYQHPHLDVVVNTGVIDILLKCLMNDRSTVMITVALHCLLMLLPHIPVTVASQLPRLFLIYSRCLVWEKFSASTSKEQKDLVTDNRAHADSDDEDDQLFSIDPDWKVVDAVPDAPEAQAPETLSFFTYLYGLYPLNFTSYIRKPRKYLKQIDFPGAEDFDLDQAIIRSRTEQYQRVHLLHPSFFNLTVEDELTDNRWLKAEPSEVVAECLGLYLGYVAPNAPGVTVSNSPIANSPVVVPKAPIGSIFDTIASPISPTSPLSPSSMAQSTDSLQFKHTQSSSNEVIYLQRELTAIRSELNFERYLKQQHAVAIGQLKKDRVKAVAVETETATLINMNRALTRKLNDAVKFNENLQKETQSRKTHARQSEDQLNAKLRSMRASLADQKALEASLEQAHADIEELRQLVVESESRELRAKEKAESLEGVTAELEKVRAELAALKNGASGQPEHAAEANGEGAGAEGEARPTDADDQAA